MHEIIELTRKLIEFKTTRTRPEELQACSEFIRQYLQNAGVTSELFESDGTPSVLSLPKPGFAPILLMTHFDVVEAPDRLFKPEIRDGRLYGRGAVDDKYAVALSMVLLKNHAGRVIRSGQKAADLPFGILMTGDEETGGFNGAKKIMGRIRSDFCIALDGGNLDKIVTKEKGLIELKLTTHGKTAHGARPWLGENAIEKLIADYLEIQQFFKGLDTPDHWHRTMNFSIFKAGGPVNQVPGRAEATFDIRYTEHDDMEEIIAQIRAQISGDLDIVLHEPMFEALTSPHLSHLLEIAPGTETGFEHGASDARFLKEYSIPGIVWGADGEASQHSENEHVTIESVINLYEILDEYFKRSDITP